MASTTLAAAVAAIKTQLDTLVGVSPGSPTIALRKVIIGPGGPNEAPKPFLSIQRLSDKKVGVIDGNNTWKIDLKLRIVFPISAKNTGDSDAMNYMGQISDLIDGLTPITGVEGLELGTWSTTIPESNSQGQNGFVESILSFMVETARGNS